MSKKKKSRGASPLSLRERCIIETRWCLDSRSITEIALELKRNKSSVSRELAGKPRRGIGKYRADIAHAKALNRISKRGNVPKTERIPELKSYIEDKMINEDWSPEQISIRLPHEYKKDTRMRIATESIYQEVYRRVHRGGNGAVKKGMIDLRPHLVRRHKRRAKKGFRKGQRVEREATLPSIEARPKVVERRIQFGHWEDDTMESKKSLARLKTFNERVSGIHLFGKTKDGKAQSGDEVMIKRLRLLPSRVRKTLTRDRGSENIRWQEVRDALDLDGVYFAHSFCSHERGSNENNNGLIRRYFPKGTDWATVSDEDIARVEYLLNTRPRKRHGGLTPNEVFYKATGVALFP